MVCDPQGKRKVMAESLADLHRENVEPGDDDYPRQGRVAYLLEICDPCQDQPYLLERLPGIRLCLCRATTRPGRRRVGVSRSPGRSKGSWSSSTAATSRGTPRSPESPVWQADEDHHGVLTIGPMTIPAPGSSHSDVNYTNDLFDNLAAAMLEVTLPRRPKRSPRVPARANGAS